jgi:quinol monooxygenase YgiN
MAAMFTVNVTLRVKPGRADEFAAGIPATVEQLERHPGTLAFIVTRSREDPHEFRFTELYRDEAAFREHLALSDGLGPMRALLEDLVEGPWKASFGTLVAGASKLDLSGTPAPPRG